MLMPRGRGMYVLTVPYRQGGPPDRHSLSS
jgi:hypothetical protein